jgi:DUF917 family protein
VLTVLDRRTGVPISCDAIRQGVEVAVLQLAAAEFWTDPRHLPAPRVRHRHRTGDVMKLHRVLAHPVLLPRSALWLATSCG